jgi:hypothetical protein
VEASAVSEGGVVGEDCADAGEDGVGGVAEALDFGAGSGASDPVRLVGSAGLLGGSKIPVDRKSGFEGDEWFVVLDEVGEGVVEVAGWLLKSADGDFDSGGAESGDAFAADLRVGVLCRNDGSVDTGFDEGIGAGTSSSVVRTGFQGDVGGRSRWIDATFVGLLEGDDLGVVAVGVEVRAFGDDLAAFDKDAAYLWIG